MTTILFMNFAWSYPLFLWLIPQEKIDTGFFKFNLGLSIIIGFCGICVSFFTSGLSLIEFIQLSVNFVIAIWLGLLFILTWYFWNREKFPLSIITVLSIAGFWISSVSAGEFHYPGLTIAGFIIGTLALSSVAFSMILGHWYLNVVNLSIEYIRKSVITLGIILIIRLLWNFWKIGTSSVVVENSGTISILHYLQSFEGVFLWIAILFGIIGALIINLLTYKTVKLHSTQSATGLLYVNLVMILMAEMIYKYYMIQTGLIL